MDAPEQDIPKSAEISSGAGTPPGCPMELPIRMRMSQSRVGWTWVALIVLGVALSLMIYIAETELQRYFIEGECRSKRGLLRGDDCIPHLVASIVMCLSLLWLATMAFDQLRVGSGGARFEGYDLIITETEFWHVQLARPIEFEDIVYVNGLYAGGYLSRVCLAAEPPPALAFWSPYNFATWFGISNTFTFRPIMFYDLTLPTSSPVDANFPPILATMQFLSEKRKA
jgi:hypothetical protein